MTTVTVTHALRVNERDSDSLCSVLFITLLVILMCALLRNFDFLKRIVGMIQESDL